MASGCGTFDNAPYLFTLVRLDQHIISPILQHIEPKLGVTQARTDDYLDLSASSPHNLKHPPPVPIGQLGVGKHYLHLRVSLKHPSGPVAIGHRQDLNTAGLKCVKQGLTALPSHDEQGRDFRQHTTRRMKRGKLGFTIWSSIFGINTVLDR
jgi:hypothetical protein